MITDDVLETLPLAVWDGPFPPLLQRRAVEALESGRVLVLPFLRFELAETEQRFLDPVSLGGRRKNISLDPQRGRLSNASLSKPDAAALAAMMQRFADATLRLVTGLLPPYASSLERARTSFRPAEIAGRTYSPRHDDRLLHVDAFPARPVGGRRILRAFANVAQDGAPRAWRVGEPFRDFASAFLPRVKAPAPGSAWALRIMGLTRGRRTAYDHIMLALHDTGKLDAGYQARAPSVAIDFPAGATWLCFTDQVLHAALAGHGALEQTFHVPVAAMAHPEQAPLRVLESLTGRALA